MQGIPYYSKYKKIAIIKKAQDLDVFLFRKLYLESNNILNGRFLLDLQNSCMLGLRKNKIKLLG